MLLFNFAHPAFFSPIVKFVQFVRNNYGLKHLCIAGELKRSQLIYLTAFSSAVIEVKKHIENCFAVNGVSALCCDDEQCVWAMEDDLS